MVGARIVVGGGGDLDQIESLFGLVGWLVGLSSIPPSFPSDDREEGIERCIYSSKTQRERSTSVRYRPYRKGWYVCTRQTKQNKSSKDPVWCHAIGFVFPIGK